ncbi:MAG: transporter [Proteobacteria bacterium]|nr:transporter [Pseudomonadota bacterium]
MKSMKERTLVDDSYGCDPTGFNGCTKLGYIVNSRNKDTDYRSGQEFDFVYAAGWQVITDPRNMPSLPSTAGAPDGVRGRALNRANTATSMHNAAKMNKARCVAARDDGRLMGKA